MVGITSDNRSNIGKWSKAILRVVALNAGPTLRVSRLSHAYSFLLAPFWRKDYMVMQFPSFFPSHVKFARVSEHTAPGSIQLLSRMGMYDAAQGILKKAACHSLKRSRATGSFPEMSPVGLTPSYCDIINVESQPACHVSCLKAGKGVPRNGCDAMPLANTCDSSCGALGEPLTTCISH